MDTAHYFKDKKITVMGLGLLGRGVGDIAYMAACGADLIVTDLKSAEELAVSIERLKEFDSISYVLGEHRLEDFAGRDFILKAAGVPLDSIYIAEAKKNGIPVKMSASLFAEIAQIPIIGVTGTRGKSTTTHIIHSIFQKAGIEVLLGGNVRGVSTLALLSQVNKDSIALFELDSWQLQGFGEEKISPTISVFTTFFSDHLNYYKNDLEVYLADKANIFLYQNTNDTLILGEQCADLIEEKYKNRISSRVIRIGSGDLPTDWKLSIPGEHNRYDAAIARQVALSWGIDDGFIRAALEEFTAVAGRLELVRTVNGVAYYNDTTATTPDATNTALDALSEKYGRNILLVFGGADKGLDMDTLVARIPKDVKQVVLLAGSGTERIRAALEDVPVYEIFSEALQYLQSHAEAGDAVLLSPAFASFGMFKNEFDRGDQFNAFVATLPERNEP